MRIEKADCAFWRAGQCNACTDSCRYSTKEKIVPRIIETEESKAIIGQLGLMQIKECFIFGCIWKRIVRRIIASIHYGDAAYCSNLHSQGWHFCTFYWNFKLYVVRVK